MLFRDFNSIFSTKGSRRYGSDKSTVTHGYKDGRADGYTWSEKHYMFPAGGDI